MIQAVFFDIGGTVHTQDATPESDRDYIRRLWCFLHMKHIFTAAGCDVAEVLPEGL